MKQLPILFNGLMVQAHQWRRKFVTRRIAGLSAVNDNPDQWKKSGELFVNAKGKLVQKFISGVFTTECVCPYGGPGDMLWVRENFQYKPLDQEPKGVRFLYRADNEKACPKWKPSIHMPKDAARYWLQITNIRCERIQDITEEDAIREGIQPLLASSAQLAEFGQQYRDYLTPVNMFNEGLSAVMSFRSLIIYLDGPEVWDRNQWVWVVDFKEGAAPAYNSQHEEQ